jgi:dienelactone hydrolase
MRLAALMAAVVATAALACSSDDPDVGSAISDKDDAGLADVEDAGPSDATFARHGPYEVGITTLKLPDRKVEVYYPAIEGSSVGHAKATFDIRDGFGDALVGVVPEAVILPVEVDGYRELPISGDGPFPVVLLSHGLGGWRTVNSHLATEVASWGFVVASAEHRERNLEAMLLTRGRSPAAQTSGDYGASTMAAALDLVIDQGQPGGVLAGAVDGERVAAMGHSAGARAALALARSDPRVDTVVSWAATESTDLGDRPVMFITADGDPATATIETDVKSLTGPYRIVSLKGSGHSVFVDICPGLTGPDGLIGRARANGVAALPDAFLAPVVDGCEPGDLDVSKAWPTITHFTVAELRDAFGIGKKDTGLGKHVVDDLPADVDYEQHD